MIAKLIFKRVLMGVATVWVVSLLVFFGIEILPGDVADAVLGQGATPETLAVLREEMGLNRPLAVRYLDWLGGFVTGDLGNALGTGRSIVEMMAQRLPSTLLLGGITALVAVPLAVSLGLAAAMYPGSLFDRGVTVVTLCVISGPEFLIATILVLIFAVQLRWVPAVSYLSDNATLEQYFRALFLPVATLTFAVLAPMTRMTRSALLNVMSSPAIEMAILKGIPRMRIVLWHALPNALGPIVNVIAINLAYLITGVVVVEVIFSFPGLAKLMVDGVQGRDIPVVQACAMFFCAIYIAFYIVADVISIITNPPLAASEMSSSEETLERDAPKRKRYLPAVGVYGMVCIAILIFWLVLCLFGPWIAPYSEAEMISGDSYAPIGVHGILGTDYLGRDVLSRVIFGARMTLGLALVATVLAFLTGVISGFVAGIAGGWVDAAISRVVDAFISFPTIMLALLIVSIFGTSLPALVCAIGFIEATRVFRISRALAVNTMAQDFVEVSRARGESLWWILWHDVLPNAFIPLSTDFGLRFTFSILLLSSLSFLGLGVQPPLADWGSMVKENMTGIYVGSTALLLPALSIFSVTLAVNFLVDWNLSRSQRDISSELVN